LDVFYPDIHTTKDEKFIHHNQLFCPLVLTINSHTKLINVGESESGRIIHVDYERINNYRFSNKIIET